MKILKIKYLLFFLLVITCCLITCTNDKGIPDYHGFPDDVGKLIYTKCATSGCHTDASKDAAGGLSLQTWDALFAGGRSGAAIIPYRSDYSTLLYFTNTFSDLGVALKPTMPYNKPALSREEVTMLKTWIEAGAPDRDGFVKFSDNPNRKKYYVTNQGCDMVTVFDEASGVQMRCIDVGQSSSLENPHMVRVSPDKQYWYIISLSGLYLEKYRASDDAYVGRANIGIGYWNAFTVSGNSQSAYCTDLNLNGKIVSVDLNSMSASPLSGFNYPHGIALNSLNDSLYVTQQFSSSRMYKIMASDIYSFSQFNLFNGPDPAPISLNTHEVVFTPTQDKYFVTCQGTNEVRIFETGTDKLLDSMHVGASPTEMTFSTTTPYMFVACTEDTLTFPGKRGSVAVINYHTNTLVKYIYTGHQPHGIAVDDSKKLVVVANRNYSTDGPAPHHASSCGGRNGYVSFINMNTLDMVPALNSSEPKKIEVSVDPYSVGVR